MTAPTRAASAAVLSSLTQQIGMGAGVALGALLLTLSQTARGSVALGRMDFHLALAAAGLLSALAALFYLTLAKDAGDEVSGYSRRGGPSS